MFIGNSHTSRREGELLLLVAVSSIKQWKSNILILYGLFIAVVLVKQWITRFDTAADTVLQKKWRFHRNLLFDFMYVAWLSARNPQKSQNLEKKFNEI